MRAGGAGEDRGDRGGELKTLPYLLPIAHSRLPIPCSLFPVPCSLS
ncbi:MAG: hypothetical protein RIE73_11275 [Coleofasciculus sp. C1-SOL-03]